MPLPPSLLKEVIGALPDAWKMSSDSVPNYLQKRGVKPEELEYSGITEQLKATPGQKVSKSDLASLESARKDVHDKVKITKGSTAFDEITVAGANQDTYAENVRKFLPLDPTGKNAPRDIASHFRGAAKGSYLWHTRTSEDVIDGKNTRVVQELQSDLHQQGRLVGYEGQESPRAAWLQKSAKLLADRKELVAKKGTISKEEWDTALAKNSAEQRKISVQLSRMRYVVQPPDAPYKESWPRKAIEQELLDAHATGKDAIAIPLQGSGVDSLQRGKGVQKWYEKDVRDTLKKVARSIGGEYKEAISGETSYGQIVLPKDKSKLSNMKLYAAGGAEALLISESLSQGAPPNELAQLLVEQQGMSEEDANAAVDRAVKLNITSAFAQGATPEELHKFLVEEQGYDETYVTSLLSPPEDSRSFEERLDEKAKAADVGYQDVIEAMQNRGGLAVTGGRSQVEQTIEEQAAKVSNIYTKYASLPNSAKVGLGFGNTEDRAQAAADVAELNTFIVNNLVSQGIEAQMDPETGEIWVKNAQGTSDVLEVGMWDSLVASRAEIGFGVAAGIGTSMAVAKGLEAAKLTPGHPLAKAAVGLGAFAVTSLGSATGAVFGRAEDITRNALETKEQIDSTLMWSQLKDAGAADVVFSVAGTTLAKFGIAGAKGVYRAYDLVARGNKEGAYKALKEFSQLDDTQVDETIRGWEQLTGNKAPGLLRSTKALAIIPRVHQGAEAIVGPATSLDPLASSTIFKEITNRANDLLETAKTASSDNISTILRDELVNYKDMVKQRYGGLKEFAIREMEDTGYTFDYSKLAIDPLLERTVKSLTNPTVREQALNFMQRIRELGGVTQDVLVAGTKQVEEARQFRRGGPTVVTKQVPTTVTEQVTTPTLRSFEDLLELRRVFNEFGSKKFVKNAKDIELVVSIRKRIDGEIAKAAKQHMPQADTWMKAWRESNTEYGKMFELEANVLYKNIMRKGATDKIVAKQLMNRAMATDDTFRQVIERLPIKMRALTENAVMEQFVEKFAIGEVGGARAMQFPLLAKELSQVAFTTPKARDLKRSITAMAEVFKNDVNLAKVTGNLTIPHFQSYLTTDPMIRAKYEIASHVFNYVRRLAPTKRGDSIALIMSMGKMLEKPRNARAFNGMIKLLPPDPELRNALKVSQLQIAGYGQRSEFPKVIIHRQAAPGKSITSTKGELGEGIYYTTTRQTGPEGSKDASRSILPDRIANEDNIKAILGVDSVTPKMLRDNLQLQEVLKEKGYLGLTLGDKVLVFK